MFKKANRVTRLDKALILGFMAGYRDNPRPNAENVITIKLNESKVIILNILANNICIFIHLLLFPFLIKLINAIGTSKAARQYSRSNASRYIYSIGL